MLNCRLFHWKHDPWFRVALLHRFFVSYVSKGHVPRTRHLFYHKLLPARQNRKPFHLKERLSSSGQLIIMSSLPARHQAK